MFREALAISEKLQPNHSFVEIQLGNLANHARSAGDSAGAEPLHRRAAGDPPETPWRHLTEGETNHSEDWW